MKGSSLMSLATITPSQLAEISKSGKSIHLIDVRTPVEYREVHLEIAKNIPLDQLDAGAVAKAHGESGEPIYLICRSGNRSKMACDKFIQAGFTNVVNVEGGTLGALDCGLSVARGKKAMSLECQVRIAAGFLVFSGVMLGTFVNPWFYALSGFVGAGLMFAGITDTCAMGMIIAKMPWNQVR